MDCTLYWIGLPEHTSIATQGYLGVSKDVTTRLEDHRVKPSNAHLKNAIAKYGWGNLVTRRLVIADAPYCLSLEAALRPRKGIGWNIAIGGGMPPSSLGKTFKTGRPSWNKGISCPTETRAKISNQVTKLWENPAYKQHMSKAHQGQLSPMTGRKHSAESLLKMSATHLSKPSTRIGFKHSAATIQRMRELAMQESWECPHCHTQGKSKSAGNRWHFDRCKMKEVTSWR